MAGRLKRGEIWQYRFKTPDKQRPVVIISRQDAIDLLHTVMVAPITSRIRGAPSEVLVDQVHGLKVPSAVNLDHVQTVEKERLHRFVGSLDSAKLAELCRKLAIAAGCEGAASTPSASPPGRT